MLFDTTFLIDVEREVKRNRTGPARSFLQNNPNAPLYTSVICAGEFAEGFDANRKRDCWMCLQPYTILPIDNEIAWQAGQLSRQLRKSGQLIGDNDLWIAAIAVRNNLDPVTGNIQHFSRIPGLRVLRY